MLTVSMCVSVCEIVLCVLTVSMCVSVCAHGVNVCECVCRSVLCVLTVSMISLKWKKSLASLSAHLMNPNPSLRAATIPWRRHRQTH